MFLFLFSQFYYILSEIEGCIRKAILDKLNTDDVIDDDDVDIEGNLDLLSEIECDSGGSDSSVSDGLPMQLLHASVPEVFKSLHFPETYQFNLFTVQPYIRK